MASKNDYEKQLQDAAELERVRQWQGPPAAQIMPVNPYVAELNSVTGAQPAAQGVRGGAGQGDGNAEIDRGLPAGRRRDLGI